MDYSWQSGTDYELFMGRWSKLIAQSFLKWLVIPLNCKWLDVGCGTGIITKLVLETYQPKEIIAIDSSGDFISHAQHTILNPAVHFKVGQAQKLELESHYFDAVVSGLVLNFIPTPKTAVIEMLRVTKPGGKIGIFLWDYSEGMQMLRYFWDAAVELDKNVRELDEAVRFPLCKKEQLELLLREIGLTEVEAVSLEEKTVFKDFNDFWVPFLGNVGPAPNYAMSLNVKDRQKLENKLRNLLPVAPNGSIPLTARAWAVKAIV